MPKRRARVLNPVGKRARYTGRAAAAAAIQRGFRALRLRRATYFRRRRGARAVGRFIRRGGRMRRGGNVKVITLVTRFFSGTRFWTSSVNSDYCFVRYVYKPLQSEANAQENPLQSTNSVYPDNQPGALTGTSAYVVSHRTELGAFKDLYKFAKLKRVTWIVTPAFIEQEQRSSLNGMPTTSTWEGSAHTLVFRFQRPDTIYKVIHEERNPRNTDAANNVTAEINRVVGINPANRPVLSWPDIGADSYLASAPAPTAGQVSFMDLWQDRKLRKARRGFKAVWKPWGRRVGGNYLEGVQSTFSLRAIRDLENGVNDDTAAVGVGIEDDIRLGGLFLASAGVNGCILLAGQNDPDAFTISNKWYTIQCKATYAIFGRY